MEEEEEAKCGKTEVDFLGGSAASQTENKKENER